MAIVKLEGLKDSDGIVFKTIPAGQYNGRVTKVEEKESKNEEAKYPKCLYLNCTFQVTEEGEFKGENLFFMLMLPDERMAISEQQKSVAKIKRVCNAAGIPVDSDEFDYADLMGAEFRAVVIEKTYEGNPKNEIKDFLDLQ